MRDILINRGQALFNQPRQFIHFANHQEADALLNDIAQNPHAFLLACIMDRQIPAERAWLIPYEFRRRLGSFEFSFLSQLSLSDIESTMLNPAPLHRFNKEMSSHFFSAIRQVVNNYSSNTSNIWSKTPSSATIVKRFLQFEGVGIKIATMATNSLVRDFKIPVSDILIFLQMST
jgi:hypothetical protein